MLTSGDAYSYRYFTADLLTNDVLAEIPFKGVSYERALKGAGGFSGSIGVAAETDGLDVYNATLPGKTALYIMRNDVCVWGGIIWSRSYDVVSKKLNVNASEFTSLLYHRRAWRTWTNKFTANLSVASGVITATIDDGMTFTLAEDSTAYIIMSDVADFDYNGYYQLTAESSLNEVTQIATVTMSATSVATPTKASVTMPDGVYDAVSIEVHANTYDYVRSLISALSLDFHGTNFPNDEIEPALNTTLRITERGVDDGVATITASAAVDLIPGQEFRVRNVGPNFDGYRTVVEAAGSTIVYNSGGGEIPFASTTSITLRAISRRLQGGHALITTGVPHGLYVGQYVTLVGFDNPLSGANLYDGTFRVDEVPTPITFKYDTGTKLNEDYVTLTPATVTAAALLGKTVTGAVASGTSVTYTASNSFSVGQYVSVSGVSPSVFNIDKERITAATSTTFTVGSALPASTTYSSGGVANGYALILARRSKDNVVDLATSENHGLGSTGSSVTIDVAGLNDTVTVIARGLVANVATLTTAEAHGFSVGNPVTVSGITDLAATNTGSMTISGGTATFTVDLKTGHNLVVGNTISITDVADTYSISGYSFDFGASSITFTTAAANNVAVGNKVKVSGLERRSVSCTQVRRVNKVVTLTAPANHNVKANDKVFVSGYKTTKTFSVSRLLKYGKTSGLPIKNYSLVVAKFASKHGMKAGVYFTTSWTSPVGPSGIFKNGRFRVTRIVSEYEVEYDDGLDYAGKSVSVTSPGSAAFEYSYGINGWWTVSGVTTTTIKYTSDIDEDIALTNDSTVVTVPDAAEGDFDVTAADANTFTVTATPYTVNRTRTGLAGTAVVTDGIFNVTNANVISTPSATSLTYSKSTTTYPNLRTNVNTRTITGNSVILSPYFNVTDAIITKVAAKTFSFAVSPGVKKTIENGFAKPSGLATSGSPFGGTGISATVTAGAGLRYTKSATGTLKTTRVFGCAVGTSEPEIHYGTYGGYTNNSDVLFEFSTAGYSTTQTPPVDFRGYEVRSIGEELDKYSDIINGFEYRVDCSYDRVTGRFVRTFVLLPILPDSLQNYLASLPGGVLYLGEAAPPSAFGADRLVFQFPGNISDLSVEESAENSATRFFMVGNAGDLGDDASQPYAVAVAKDLLYPTSGTMTAWPLLDDTFSDQDLYDEDVLYSYAQRYLAEARPPDTKITVAVNGSITPGIGTYSPGDWCTLIIDDEFIRQRLRNDLEPRGDVIVRKIDGLSVTVPDGATFPEKISLTLIPEWQADQVGK